MLKVKGIYDGARVILLESVTLLPNTEVEVLIPEANSDPEHAYWRRLMELGLVMELRTRSVTERPYMPIQISGTPISKTIIDERR